MRWWVLILLPFHLLAQETYTNCGDIIPQNYQVSYDADKVYYWDISDGDIIYNQENSITVQWPDSIGTYIISVYTKCSNFFIKSLCCPENKTFTFKLFSFILFINGINFNNSGRVP